MMAPIIFSVDQKIMFIVQVAKLVKSFHINVLLVFIRCQFGNYVPFTNGDTQTMKEQVSRPVLESQ